jgi:hypothetical protein
VTFVFRFQQPIMTRPETPEGGGALPIGETSDERRKRLQEERKKEYNDMIKKVRVSTGIFRYNIL